MTAGFRRATFIGFGELGSTLAERLSAGGAHDVSAYAPRRRDPCARQALAKRLERAGARRAPSIDAAVREAEVVFAVVPASAAGRVAALASAAVQPGALYADLSTMPPERQRAAAEAFEARGADYADVAVLGTTVTDGWRVPLLASGSGAGRFRDALAPAGFRVAVVAGPAGDATRIKLLRSVYLKGRDALVAELLAAARAHGLEEAVMGTIPTEPATTFRAVAERVMCSLALHADRRADELRDAAAVVREAGIAPIVTLAGVERLRAFGLLGLRERFGGERPAGLVEVLNAVEAAGVEPRDRPGDPPRPASPP